MSDVITTEPITVSAAVARFRLTRQQIKDGIEAGVIEAWSVSKPGGQRNHLRMTPESVQAYRDILRTRAA